MFIDYMVRRAVQAVAGVSKGRRSFRHTLYRESIHVARPADDVTHPDLLRRDWSRQDWLDAIDRHPTLLVGLIRATEPDAGRRLWLGRRLADQIRYLGKLDFSYMPIEVRDLARPLILLDNEDGAHGKEVERLFGHLSYLREKQLDGRDRKADRVAATGLAEALAASRRLGPEEIRLALMASSAKAELVAEMVRNDRVGAEVLRDQVFDNWPGYISLEDAHHIAGTAAHLGRQDVVYEMGTVDQEQLRDAAWRHASPTVFRTLLVQQADSMDDRAIVAALTSQTQTFHTIDLPTGILERGLGELIRRSGMPEQLLDKFAQPEPALLRILLADPDRTVRLFAIQRLGQVSEGLDDAEQTASEPAVSHRPSIRRR